MRRRLVLSPEGKVIESVDVEDTPEETLVRALESVAATTGSLGVTNGARDDALRALIKLLLARGF